MMSWQDIESGWSRTLKRRILIKILLCASSLILTIAAFIMFLWLDNSIKTLGSDGTLGDLLLVAFVPLGLSQLIFSAFMYYQIRRERAVLQYVPEHDGLVCPRCLTILADAPVQGSCSKCGEPYTTDEVQSYWVDYSLARDRLRPWGIKSTWRQRFRSFRKLTQTNILALLALQIPFFVAMLIVSRWTLGTSFIGALIRWGPFFVGMILMGTASFYLRRYRERSGQTRHCAQCDYQQAPEGKNPDRCPECGSDWSRSGGAVTGTQHRESRYLLAACTMYGFAALFMIMYIISQAQGAGWLLRVVPTSTLIHDTTTCEGYTTNEWVEIGRRQLTKDEQLQLAVGLIDMRLRSDYLNRTEGGWLWTQISTGALPDDLVDRFYHEMLEVWIETPSTIRKGELFDVSLGSNFRSSNLPSGINEVVYFGGFFVDKEPTPIARKDKCTYALLMDKPKYLLGTPLQLDHTGSFTIRAVLYFAIGPALARADPPAQWKEDETATIPSAAVWSHRIEVKKVVQVVE